MSTDRDFSVLHAALAAELLERVRSGTASSSDLNVARQFLKDNAIDATPEVSGDLARILTALPYASREDDPIAQSG